MRKQLIKREFYFNSRFARDAIATMLVNIGRNLIQFGINCSASNQSERVFTVAVLLV